MLPPAEAEWEGEDAWASVCVTHAGAAHDQDNCNAHVEFYDPHKPPQLAKLEPRLLPLTSDYTHPIHIFGANMAPTGDKLLCRFDGATLQRGRNAAASMTIHEASPLEPSCCPCPRRVCAGACHLCQGRRGAVPST
eukprot:scaffold265340_cov30-Tisochrysis_lutea.AAC.3